MENENVVIKEERISAEEYNEFLRRTGITHRIYDQSCYFRYV